MTSSALANNIASEIEWPRAVYIHVPFCAHRCGYCDFTLIAGRDDLVSDYLRALEREIENSNVPIGLPIDTLFLGGGTPTNPTIPELKSLFQILEKRFQLTPGVEFSVEANPLDLTDEKLDLLASFGVNRISLGVQSFSLPALQLLERDHQPNDISEIVARVRRYFHNLSLDLIFGVPGQSNHDWHNTLQQSIALKPNHLSTYGLTFETGTAFWTRRERGEMNPVDEELEREQYAMAMDELAAAGYEHYEISNFARPGFQCRHNLTYWSGDEYLAFGPGASRYFRGRRETNIRSVLGWLDRMDRDVSPVAEQEELDHRHRAIELIYLGLRRIEGISRSTFHERTGFQLDELCGGVIRDQVKMGFLTDDGSKICLSREGRFVADRVILEFL